MKKIIVICSFVCCCIAQLSAPYPASAQIPIIDIIKAAVKAVIRAIDLQVQRLQNKTIALQNIQKEIENTFSKLKLDEISDWTEKQKEIYRKYFDELWRVKTIIAYYKKTIAIVDRQKSMVAEYKRVYQLLRTDKNFTAAEIRYMYDIYSGIIDKSLQSVQQILILIESFGLQMTDADRLKMLDNYSQEIENYYSDMRGFTDRNISISLSRAKTLQDINAVRGLYGLPTGPAR